MHAGAIPALPIIDDYRHKAPLVCRKEPGCIFYTKRNGHSQHNTQATGRRPQAMGLPLFSLSEASGPHSLYVCPSQCLVLVRVDITLEVPRQELAQPGACFHRFRNCGHRWVLGRLVTRPLGTHAVMTLSRALSGEGEPPRPGSPAVPAIKLIRAGWTLEQLL